MTTNATATANTVGNDNKVTIVQNSPAVALDGIFDHEAINLLINSKFANPIGTVDAPQVILGKLRNIKQELEEFDILDPIKQEEFTRKRYRLFCWECPPNALTRKCCWPYTNEELLRKSDIISFNENQQRVALLPILTEVNTIEYKDDLWSEKEKLQLLYYLDFIRQTLTKSHHWVFDVASYDSKALLEYERAKNGSRRNFMLNVVSIFLLIYPVVANIDDNSLDLAFLNISAILTMVINVFFNHIDSNFDLNYRILPRNLMIDRFKMMIFNKINTIKIRVTRKNYYEYISHIETRLQQRRKIKSESEDEEGKFIDFLNAIFPDSAMENKENSDIDIKHNSKIDETVSPMVEVSAEK